MKTFKYTVFIEKGKNSYGGFTKENTGCYAVGKTKAEVKKLMRNNIKLYLEELYKNNEVILNPEDSEYIKDKIINVEINYKDFK